MFFRTLKISTDILTILGEQFLWEEDSGSSSKCDENCSDTELFEEDIKKEIFYDKKRMSTALLDDFRLEKHTNFLLTFTFSLSETEALERLANGFKSDLSEAIHIALSIDDDETKINFLKVNKEFQIFHLKYFNIFHGLSIAL